MNPFRVRLAGVLACLVVLAGCGGPAGPKNTVSGKVTLGTQPVAGKLTWVGPDGKSVDTPISPDGTYTVNDPGMGENKIQVTGFGAAATGAGPAPIVPKDGSKMPGTGPGGAGVPPPAKYSNPNNGLKFTVTGGKQTFDITLTP